MSREFNDCQINCYSLWRNNFSYEFYLYYGDYTKYDATIFFQGIDKNLINLFAVILKALASGLEINDVLFKEYCYSTADLYVKLYSWYHMPPIVHKLLIHGSAIAKEAALPIGQLSEEAMEVRNKDIGRFREHHTRKFSRIATNEDLFKRLLLNSDPMI